MKVDTCSKNGLLWDFLVQKGWRKWDMEECPPLYYVKFYFNNNLFYSTKPKNEPFSCEMKIADAYPLAQATKRRCTCGEKKKEKEEKDKW